MLISDHLEKNMASDLQYGTLLSFVDAYAGCFAEKGKRVWKQKVD